MRQGPDQMEFKEVLENIANGKFTRENWNYFRERDLQGPNFSNEERKAIKEKSIKICALVNDTKKHNIERIKALGKPIHGIKSLNQGKDAKFATTNEAQGLLQDLIIAKGSRVLLTRNLWQSYGLCNGSVGEVRYILYPGKSNDPKLQLPVVICHFPDYTGPSCLENEEKCVPIVVQENHFTKNKQQCMRIMLPLKPGYAISIHSSQGATLNSVIINLGNREFATGLCYVAPSRVRKIQNLYFDPMPSFPRFTSMRKTKIFAQRIKQDEKEKASDAKYAAIAKEKIQKNNESL